MEEMVSNTDIIEAYESLLARALAATEDVVYVSEPDFARLHIKGKEAWFTYPRDETSYDCTSIETDKTSRFPADLIDMAPAELKAWKAAKAKADKKAETEWRIERQQQVEAGERATLEALKKKYER